MLTAEHRIGYHVFSLIVALAVLQSEARPLGYGEVLLINFRVPSFLAQQPPLVLKLFLAECSCRLLLPLMPLDALSAQWPVLEGVNPTPDIL